LGSSSKERRRMSRRNFLKATVATVAVGAAAASTIQLKRQQLAKQKADPFAKHNTSLNVNGKTYPVQLEPNDMLVNVLREKLNLVGTKRPCNRMECGGCTVLIDNKPYYSCTYLALRAVGKKILTVEGRENDAVPKAVQDAWVEADASQCGYCQPGQVMSATALLKSNPNPNVRQIKNGMSGNLCRCGTYMNIIEAIQLASQNLRSKS